MEVKEAIDWIKLVKGTFNDKDKRVEALEIAIRALEKQMPKRSKNQDLES